MNMYVLCVCMSMLACICVVGMGPASCCCKWWLTGTARTGQKIESGKILSLEKRGLRTWIKWLL